MSNDLAQRTTGIQIRSMDDLARVADMMAKSGFFQDAKEAAQAGVKVMAGAAWGIDPFNAMTGIHIIKGKPAISAGLMAAAVKRHPKYDYRLRERSDQVCSIEFFEGSESLGVHSYTMEMAKRAELTNNPSWKKFPDAMLFARCMSSGVRAFMPDVFSSSVYTPEELGATVNGDDEVVEFAPVSASSDSVDVQVVEVDSEASTGPSDARESIGVERAATLQKLLEKQGVSDGLKFANVMLEFPVEALSDITQDEGMELLEHAARIKREEVE